jgi:hypothetical protein
MATERPSTMEEDPRPLAQVWTRLATRGLDTLLVVNPASGNDLTGNVTFAVGTYQGPVVPTEGDVSLLTSELGLPGGRPLVVDRGQAASAAGEDRLQTIRKAAGTAWSDARHDRDRASRNFMPVERYDAWPRPRTAARLTDGPRIRQRRSPQGLPAPVPLRLKGGAPRAAATASRIPA